MVTFEWSDWRNKCIYWIQSLYVERDFRRKGVFNEMYKALKRMVENDDSIGGIRLYVDRNNVEAQKVYEKLGMDGDHYRVFEWIMP
jgi:ribosomal protein S18 acetylase RimI-like enzyme